MDLVQNFIQTINRSASGLNLNFIDIIILVILLFYAYEGYAAGFIVAFFDFLSFVLSFALALKFYSFFAGFLVSSFNMPHGFANAFGFFIAAFVIEIILNLFLRNIYKHFTFRNENPNKTLKTINQYFGVIPGIASAVVLLSFLLTIIISLPFSPFLKNSVSFSRFGSQLVANTAGAEKKLNDVFGGAINETINFLTVKPEGDELVNLNFKASDVKVDVIAEQKMFEAVNLERTSRGLSALTFDNSLRDIARIHSEDMFKRGYFSHYTPEGVSPFDRMAKADITFLYAGENLALAPNTDIAMQGLMNSPGHKANILSTNFAKIGIGVMDGGIYGEMFTQEFTN